MLPAVRCRLATLDIEARSLHTGVTGTTAGANVHLTIPSMLPAAR